MICIYIILFLIVYKLFDSKIEHYDALLKKEKGNYTFLKHNDERFKNAQCCLVEKEIGKDNKYYYKYTKQTGYDCDPNLVYLPLNKKALFQQKDKTIKNFCSKERLNLGSCKRLNFECHEFKTKKTCKKFIGMEWFPYTCEKFVDRTPELVKTVMAERKKYMDDLNKVLPSEIE
jgi:hypothetical protein